MLARERPALWASRFLPWAGRAGLRVPCSMLRAAVFLGISGPRRPSYGRTLAAGARLCGGLCLAQPVQSELIEREEDGDDEEGDPVNAEYQQGERGDHDAADAQ